MRRISATRQKKLEQRRIVRENIIKRANNKCEYEKVIPEIRCNFYFGRGLEVDEIRGGSYRCTEWLKEECCKLTCPAHHDWKTNNKMEVMKRLKYGPFSE